MVPPSSIARLREAAELVGRLHARMESVYDGATQGAEWQPDAICQEAASTILALLAERQAMEEALAAVKVEMSELKRSNVILGEMLGEKTKTLVAAEASNKALLNALKAARGPIASLIAAEYNVETWGLKMRLELIDVALRAHGGSRSE